MMRRWFLASAVCLALAPAAAFAEEDAVSSPDDATAVEDAGATDAGPADVAEDVAPDAGPADVAEDVAPDAGPVDVGPSQDATGTTEPFNVNPCWDDKCAKETAACQANADCAKLAGCHKKADSKCIESFADSEAAKLYNDIQVCGWKACNDPTKGTCKDLCGKYLGATAPCNCDKECKQFGDCCADYDQLCGAPAPTGTCMGTNCDGKSQDGTCYCDAECAQNNDCCKDYETVCKSGTCTPQCTGKECGDDGCGGTCGTCAAGGACDASGQCLGGQPVTDAGTGDAAQADGTAADGTAADAGVTADAGTVPVPTPTSSGSSGCTAGGSAQGTGGWLFGLVGLMAALVLRRRFA